VVVALVALALLPCAVALLITHSDEIAERVWRACRRGCRQVYARALDYRMLRGRPSTKLPEVLPGPPIEQVAADLRRLSRQRVGIAMRSTVWFAAVQRAYDERLQQACQSLGVDQHLADLDGLDRDIERVRVEGELQAAGLVLGSVDVDRRQDHR
jgi:hypothetical protein